MFNLALFRFYAKFTLFLPFPIANCVILFLPFLLVPSQEFLSQMCKKRRNGNKIKCSENNTTGKRENVFENGKENLGGEKIMMSPEIKSRYRKYHAVLSRFLIKCPDIWVVTCILWLLYIVPTGY
jgi:hypothetical protein